MIHLTAIFIFSLVATVYSDTPKLTFVAEPADAKLMWHTDLTLECTWNASAVPERAAEDMLVDGGSVWASGSRYYVNDPSKKIEVEQTEGKMKIVVKDLTAADSGAKFQCSMTQVGVSEFYTLDVLEPPSGQPNYINIEPNFEDAKVTFANVDGAIKYKVGYQADQTADWTETEITETAVTLTGLSVATKYTVRVEPGNEAGYRSDAETVDIKSNTFTTKDNRPPKPVSGLSAAATGTPAYNSTSVKLTWSFDDNTNAGIVVTAVQLKVMKDGADLPDLASKLGPDAVSADLDLPGAGNYEFVVEVINDYSDTEDTTATITHEVKATTAPPPTEPPKITTPTPVIGLLCADPNSADYNMVEDETSSMAVREVIPGSSITLGCYLSDDSTKKPDSIEWSTGDIPHENLVQQTGVDYTVANKSSILVIPTANENHAGVYICTLGDKTCEFQVTVTGASTDTKENSASATFTSTCLIIISLAFLQLNL